MICTPVNFAMNRTPQIFQAFVSFLSATAVWLLAATQALAADPPKANQESGGAGDYMLSYLVVVMGIALGLIVVAKNSSRRDRERPAGYVEKNLAGDE